MDAQTTERRANGHVCNKEHELARLCVMLQNAESMIVDIHKALHGNGRPGLITEVTLNTSMRKAAAFVAGAAFIETLAVIGMFVLVLMK